MATQTTNCPKCSAPDPWVRSGQYKCNYCGTVWSTDTPSSTPPAPTLVNEQNLEEVMTPLPQPPARTSRSAITALVTSSVVLFALACLVLTILILPILADNERRTVEIDTRGRYVVPEITCFIGKTKVDFGFLQQEPVLSVYPGIEGQDRWVVSSEIKTRLDENQLNSTTYLRVYCEGDPQIELYAARPVPDPEDGRQVVLRGD